MNELTTILMSVLGTEDPKSTNYIIADYIMKHADQLDSISTSTTTLAAACNVSKASISRFCRKVGLEDFLSLRYLIKAYRPGKTISSKYSFEKGSDNIICDFLNESIDRIQYMKNSLDMPLLDEITADISQFENVIIMGSQQSSAIALSMQNDLTTFSKFTTICGDPKKQLELLKTTTKKDLIIVFSATAGFFDRIMPRDNVMNRENRPKIYLITVNEYKKLFYVYKTIQLYNKYNYSSNILFNFYVALIAINYRKNIHAVSLCETVEHKLK